MNTRSRPGREPSATESTEVSESTADAVDDGIRSADVSRFEDLYEDAIGALLDGPVTDR